MDETPRSWVAAHLVARHRRAGQDELADGLAVIDGVTDVVPDLGLHLPLIDQAGRVTFQQELGIDGERLASHDIVEANLASGSLARRFGLTARLGAFDDDRADGC